MLPWQPFFAFYILGAHWRHLKNTTEPPTCGGDAALCQITLTTCYHNHYHYQCCCYWCCYLLPEQGSVQSRWTCLSGCLALVASSTDRELQLVVFCTASWRRSRVQAAHAQLQPFSKHSHVQRLVSVPRQISEVQLQMVSLCKLLCKNQLNQVFIQIWHYAVQQMSTNGSNSLLLHHTLHHML